mmetsp:Transcript_22300/g.36916  ORF Transcript_22300/g.36916 Transcript_22300/m.36916 type:complete len:244 (-) Transcript_22300:510-1241(-)
MMAARGLPSRSVPLDRTAPTAVLASFSIHPLTVPCHSSHHQSHQQAPRRYLYARRQGFPPPCRRRHRRRLLLRACRLSPRNHPRCRRSHSCAPTNATMQRMANATTVAMAPAMLSVLRARTVPTAASVTCIRRLHRRQPGPHPQLGHLLRRHHRRLPARHQRHRRHYGQAHCRPRHRYCRQCHQPHRARHTSRRFLRPLRSHLLHAAMNASTQVMATAMMAAQVLSGFSAMQEVTAWTVADVL